MAKLVSVEITVDVDVLERLQANMRAHPGLVNRRFAQALQQIQARALARLREQPPASKPGTFRRYATPKQKRYVAAFVLKKDKEGNLLPYQRTGRFVQGWKAEYTATENGGLFTMSNQAQNKRGDYIEQYITGIFQQGFHRETGWYQSQEILADTLLDAETTLIKLWKDTLPK